MGLENPDYIDDLVITNPTPQDLRREGDDHIRNLKKAIKATFPNFDGPIGCTFAELAYLSGVTGNIQVQLDNKLESSSIDLTPYALLAVAQEWGATQRNQVIDHGDQSGSLIMNMGTSPNHVVRAVDNLTLSFSNLAEGQDFIVKIIQGKSDGLAAVTLPSIHWPRKTAPTLVSVQDDYDIVAGKYIDGQLVGGFLGDLG